MLVQAEKIKNKIELIKLQLTLTTIYFDKPGSITFNERRYLVKCLFD